MNKKLVSTNIKFGADRRKQLERIRRKDLEIQKQTNQIAQLQTDLRKAERVHVFSQQAASGQGSMSRMCFEANVSKFEISKESARQIRVYNQCAVKKQAASGNSSRELEGVDTCRKTYKGTG